MWVYRAEMRASELMAWFPISAVCTWLLTGFARKASSDMYAATLMSAPFMLYEVLGSSAARFGGRPLFIAGLISSVH